MNDLMKSDMQSIAGRVQTVDLTDRAQHTARRLRVARTSIAGIAALALAGGAALGVATIPSDSPAAAGGMEGRYVFTGPKLYQDDESLPDNGTHIEIAVWDSDDELTTYTTDGPGYLGSEQVSPDGELLSYVGGDKKVHILNLDDGKEVSIPELDSTMEGYTEVGDEAVENFPVWTPDSARLWVDSGKDSQDERYGFLDIETGEFEATEPPAGVSTRVTEDSDGNQHLVSLRASDSDKGLELVKVNADDGEEEEEVMTADSFGDSYISGLDQVSDDGYRVCVQTRGEPVTEPAENQFCNTVASWAPDDEKAEGAVPTVFGSEGAMLVGEHDSFLREQENDYVLSDSQGTELQTIVIPEEIRYKGYGLMGHVPKDQ